MICNFIIDFIHRLFSKFSVLHLSRAIHTKIETEVPQSEFLIKLNIFCAMNSLVFSCYMICSLKPSHIKKRDVKHFKKFFLKDAVTKDPYSKQALRIQIIHYDQRN